MSHKCPEGCFPPFHKHNKTPMIASQLKTATILTSIIGTISLVSALSIVISICILRYYKSISHRLILYLAIADIFQSMAVVTGYRWLYIDELDANDSSCPFQGFMFTFGDNASAFWSACICIYVVSYGFFNKTIPYFEYIAHAVCWGVPLFFAGIAFALPGQGAVYGPIGIWCWITEEYDTARLYLQYLWLAIILVILTAMYTFMALRLRNMALNPKHADTEKEKDKLFRVMRKLLGYPITFFCVFMPLAMQRFSQACGAQPPFDYFVFAACLFVSNGFWNSVVYGTTRQIYKRVYYHVTGRSSVMIATPEKTEGYHSKDSVGTSRTYSI